MVDELKRMFGNFLKIIKEPVDVAADVKEKL